MKKARKAFLTMLSLILCSANIHAAEMSVSNVTIIKGGTALMEVNLTNTDIECTGIQFILNLPQGITPAKDASNAFILQKGTRISDVALTIGMSDKGNNTYQFLGYQGSGLPVAFPGTEGQVLTIMLQADNTVAIGEALNASLSTVYISDTSAQSHTLSDAPFTITVTEPIYTVLDENATTVPASSGSEAVSIRVLRTIKAGEWSTICLPFAMTEAETKRVFGNDVQLFSFTDYEATFDEVTDECTNITVNFEDADLASWGFEANIPYLIKVSSPITQFETTAVIEPDEAGAIVEFDNGRTGSRRVVYGTFYGTLRAGTKVPANCLFIGNDKFYYSTGKTNIKAFRGYFEFDDILTVVEGGSGVKMNFNAADEATGIGEIKNEKLKINNDVPVYDLTGRRVGRMKNGSNSDSSLSPGIYIVGGKKVFKNQ